MNNNLDFTNKRMHSKYFFVCVYICLKYLYDGEWSRVILKQKDFLNRYTYLCVYLYISIQVFMCVFIDIYMFMYICMYMYIDIYDWGVEQNDTKSEGFLKQVFIYFFTCV
jgi:hypothetical protein